jgi:hypothetical protein
MLSLPSLGLTMGIVNMFVEFLSLEDPSKRMFDDGTGMHEYLLCTILGLW